MTKITSSRSRTKGRRDVHGRRSPDTPLSSSSSSPSPFTAKTVSAGAPQAVADETDGCLEAAGVQKLGGGALRDVGVDAEESAATAPRTSSPSGSRASAAAWKAHTEGREPVKEAGGGGQGLEAATHPKSGAEDGGPRSQCRDSATGASGRRARGTEGTAAARGAVAVREDLSATTSTDVRSPQPQREVPLPP